MENASKALIMAGGVLIALMIIGALLLMFNQISAYQKSNSDSQRDVQLANFNIDFDRYSDSKNIKGVDIITLINKIVDYNARAGMAENNYVDYNIKMSIEVGNLKKFKQKYAVDSVDSLFPDKLIVGAGVNNFANTIATYSSYESTYTLSVMSKLASSYNTIKESGYKEGTQNYKDLIKQITGKDSNNIPTLQQIKQYKQYSEFKTSTFKSCKDSVYQNGQIKTLYFEFVD